MYDLIIIGAGPAGLSAAIYAKRAALSALVLEQNPLSGGQILSTYEVDNYPGLPGIGGFELATAFREHADKLGCAFAEAQVTGIREEKGPVRHFVVDTTEGDSTYQARSVIIAGGATHAKLGVAGEIELAGMGVSYCATCDGAFFRGRSVAVIGGGDVAVEDAIFLSRICERVYLIHRRDELRAVPILGEALKAISNVEILWNTVAEGIDGQDMVEGLRIKNVRSGGQSTLSVAGVFIAVGIVPNTEAFRHIVACDERGYIIADEDGMTSTPGIFAAGDIRTKKLRQIVTAVADGAVAVTSVQEYLR